MSNVYCLMNIIYITKVVVEHCLELVVLDRLLRVWTLDDDVPDT